MTAAIVFAVMALGVAGTVIPGVPGLPIVWLGALGYGIVEGFGTSGIICFSIITVLSVAGVLAAYIVPPKRASSAGAAKSSIAIGIALAIVGFFAVPPLGFVIGGVLGIYLGERGRRADHDAAWTATVATLIGFGIGFLVELVAALACVAVFGAWLLTN